MNSYIAIKDDGGKVSAKLKGAFADCGPGMAGAAGQKKNPDCQISTEAVIEYLKGGTPIEETVEWCDDFRKFLTVRRVTGGAQQDGHYIGKTIRWYYAKGVTSGFVYANSGKAVPSSIGAKPCMELPSSMPHDIDYGYYIDRAADIL